MCKLARSWCSDEITHFSSVPSLQDLISQFFINGFEVDFGEHDLRMSCSWGYCMQCIWAINVERSWVSNSYW